MIAIFNPQHGNNQNEECPDHKIAICLVDEFLTAHKDGDQRETCLDGPDDITKKSSQLAEQVQRFKEEERGYRNEKTDGQTDTA
jgi:hypothetical protein